MSSNIALELSCNDLDPSRIQSLTRELAKDLQRFGIGSVNLKEGFARLGAKGDPVTIGQIVLTLVGSGGVAVTLAQVLKAYVERKPSLHIEVVRPDGEKRVLDASSLNTSQLAAAEQMIDGFLRDGHAGETSSRTDR
jgi:Effector Associated Constant Component 1